MISISPGATFGAWRELSRPTRRLLLVLGATCLFEGYTRSIVGVALPQIRETFDLSQAQASAWLTVVYLGALPALALCRVADRSGRRRVLGISIIGFTVATALTGVAPNMASFVACQFTARVFLNAETAIVWTIATEEAPNDRRGIVFGFLAMNEALGIGLAAILFGGFLAPLHLSWRLLYLVTIPVLVLVGFMRRQLPTIETTPAHIGGTLVTRWHDLFTGGRRRIVVLVLTATLLFELTAQAATFALDFLQTDRGLSASTAIVLLILAGLPGIPLMIKAGDLSDRYGRRIVACGFASLSICAAVVFFWAPGGIPVLLPSLAVMVAGQLAAWPILEGYATEVFPAELRSQAAAWAIVARVIGSSISLGIGGILIATTGSLSASVTILALGPLAAIAIVATRFPDTHNRELADIVP